MVMLDGLSLALSMVASAVVVAATVRWLTIRTVRRRGSLENRAWTFCPRCGTRRLDDREVVAASGEKGVTTTSTREGILPSAFLQKGWCRPEAALDAGGCEVLASNESSVAWSILGACDRAFEPHSAPWRAFQQELHDILAQRYGGVSPREWNDHASRTHETVVEVAREVERQAGLRPCSPG